MPTLNELRDIIHKNAVEHGFYENEQKPHSEAVHLAFTAQKIALIHAELSEALEALRKGIHADTYLLDFSLNQVEVPFPEAFETHVKDTFEDEIADAIIRLLDLCGALGIDIDNHVQIKMKYNKQRPSNTGKSFEENHQKRIIMKNWIKAIIATLAVCVGILGLVWLFAETFLITCAFAVIAYMSYSLKKHFDKRDARWKR